MEQRWVKKERDKSDTNAKPGKETNRKEREQYTGKGSRKPKEENGQESF